MRSEYAKLNLAISSADGCVCSDGFDVRVPVSVQIHGGNVMDLIFLWIEIVVTSSHGNCEEFAFVRCGFVLLSVIQLPNLFHGLVQANNVHLGLTHHPALPRRLDGRRLSLPFFFEAECAEAKAIASHYLGCEGLPHVSSHAELPNSHGDAIAFNLNATGCSVVGLGRVFRNQDGQMERRSYASRNVHYGD